MFNTNRIFNRKILIFLIGTRFEIDVYCDMNVPEMDISIRIIEIIGKYMV